MSAVVGERDKALRATFPRNINPTAGVSLLLDVDPPAFHQNSAGIPTIQSAKFTATPVGFAGTVMWSITSGGKLTGTTPNERTLLFSDMTADSVKVTVTIVHQGEALIRVRTFFKVIDGAKGDDASDVDLSPAALIAALENRITESQLYSDLRTRISLVDSPASVIGSVAARVKAETDGRIAAIDKEVQDRIDAIYAKGQAIDAFVRDYTYSKVESNSSLAIQASQIAAAYTNAVSTAAADVRNYAYSKSSIDSAEAAQSAALTTSYTAYADAARTAAVSTANADVRQYSYAKSATDSAIAAAESRLRSEFVGSGGATEAYVTSYAYSKSQIDQSEAAQTSAITANYKAYSDTSRDLAISAASADVRNYSYSKANSDSALSSLANTLRSEFSSTSGVTTAYLENYAYSKAQTNSAITQQTSTLVSTVGQHTTALQTQGTSIDGLSAQYTVKIDNNGRVSGFGLASTPINGVPYSAMIFNVDALSVALPGGAGKPIMTVGQVNGQSQAVFRTDMFVDGAITARMLKIGTSDNIVPDPGFNDLAWWGRTGTRVNDYSNSSSFTFFKGGRTLVIEPNANYEVDTFSSLFPIEPGATYRIEYQINLSSDFTGNFSAYLNVRPIYYEEMSSPRSGVWPNGDPAQFSGASTKGTATYSATITMPIDSRASMTQWRLRSRVNSGYIEVGSFSITRVSDSVLIADGAVTANKIQVNSLQAISSIVIARPNGQGAGQDLDVYGGRTYDPNGVRRFQFGNLDV